MTMTRLTERRRTTYICACICGDISKGQKEKRRNCPRSLERRTKGLVHNRSGKSNVIIWTFPCQHFRELDRIVSLPTIHLWIRMLRYTGHTDSSYSPGRSRTVRTKISISKVKHCLKKAQSFWIMER